MFLIIKAYLHLNCVLMLNWIIWNRSTFIKMDLALNNLQRLICYKTQTTYQNHYSAVFLLTISKSCLLSKSRWSLCIPKSQNIFAHHFVEQIPVCAYIYIFLTMEFYFLAQFHAQFPLVNITHSVKYCHILFLCLFAAFAYNAINRLVTFTS